MSTLTKIFVVVLFLLSIVGPVAFIQHVATTENYKALSEQYAQQRDTADAKAAIADVERANLQRALQAANGKVIQLEGDNDANLAAKQMEIGRLDQARLVLEGIVRQQGASLDALQKDLNKEIEVREAQKVELDRQRAENIQIGDQLRIAENTIQNQTATNETRQRQLMLKEEQLAERDAEIAELRVRIRDQAGGTGATVVTGEPKGPKIEGSVQAVKGDLASLNVGSADGVKSGMEFIVYRSSEFVGHLRVADVYPSASTGVIFQAQRDVHAGDKATTSLD